MVVIINDGSNEYKEYECKKLWRLLIASNQLQKLLTLGFTPKRLNIEICEYQRSANKFISIQKIVDNNDPYLHRHGNQRHPPATAVCQIYLYTDWEE